MSEPAAYGPLEVIVEARSDDYAPDDDRWRDQATTLYQEVRAQVPTSVRGQLVAGSKGSVDDLIVALGSAGAFTALVDCVRAWLGRDRARRVDVRWDEGGQEHHVTFSGDAVDAETMHEIARAAAARVGGQAWPADTAPS